MSYILANGCSWTNPNYGVDCGNSYHTDEEKLELGIPLGNWQMWPDYVANKFKLPIKNLAENGSSNEKIYKTTLTQISEKKPFAVFHMWTSNNRNDFFNKNMNVLNIWNSLYLAQKIINLEEDVYTEDINYIVDSNFRLAWKFISIYYPHLYNDCIIHYCDLHSNNNKLIQRIFSNVRISYLKQRHKFPNTSNDVNQSQDLQNDLLTWWVDYFIDITEWDNRRLLSQVDQIITNELWPYLATINLCDYYDLPYISVQGPVLGYQPRNLDHWKNKPHNPILTRRGENNDIFYKALNGAIRIQDEIKKHWIYNNVFKEIDILISRGKAVIEGWPLHAGWESKPSVAYSIKNFKELSQKDGHPTWQSQKEMGNFIYDLYKKNYS